jgi:hypothetical protein
MKLSIEAKVGAAVTAAFIALTLGAIAQGNSGNQTDEPNSYGLADNPRINTYISQEEIPVTPSLARATGKATTAIHSSD